MNSKLIIITVVIILVIVLAAWYLYSSLSGQQGYNIQPNQNNTSVAGDNIMNISDSLNQIPDDSSVNGDADALNQSVKSF